MRNRLAYCIALGVFGLVSPSTTFAQEIKTEEQRSVHAQFSDVFLDLCLCFDTLIVVPDGSIALDRRVYEKAITFWNAQKIGVVFRLQKKFAPSQRDYVLMVQKVEDDKKQSDECANGQGCTLAQFHEGPTTERNDHFGAYRHRASFILVHERFLAYAEDEQAEDLAHEIGHALGLGHVDDTLMQGWFSDTNPRTGFVLSERQLTALRALYRKKVSHRGREAFFCCIAAENWLVWKSSALLSYS